MEKFTPQNPESPYFKEGFPPYMISFLMIKPDFLEHLPEIQEILTENNLDLIYYDKVRLTEKIIDYFYKENLDDHFYNAMKNYLQQKDVIIIMVGGKEKNAQQVIANLKPIIRKKFQKDRILDREEIAMWESEEHPYQDKISIILTQRNVIHTADSTEESLKDLGLVFGDKFRRMKSLGNLPSELWDLFNEKTELKKEK